MPLNAMVPSEVCMSEKEYLTLWINSLFQPSGSILYRTPTLQIEKLSLPEPYLRHTSNVDP